MNSNRLVAEGIFKYFANRELLTDCFIRCNTGEVIGILGRNGCGKSTFLKILFGTISCHQKYIAINGKKYDKPYIEKGLMAYLPQHDFLPGSLKVSQGISLFLDSRREQELVSNNENILPHLHKKINMLSGGESRYLELLLLIHSPAQFILLDEPFNGLDPFFKEKVVALIQVNKATKGFIITDHDYMNIIACSDRIILITNGIFKNIQVLKELEDLHYLPSGSLSNAGLEEN
jgi:lipopolysaccharide export system ATP-binding protein